MGSGRNEGMVLMIVNVVWDEMMMGYVAMMMMMIVDVVLMVCPRWN